MEQPLPLPVADAQLHQALSDFTASYDSAMSKEKALYAMAFGNLLLQTRSVLQTGLTEGGRKKLLTNCEICLEMLGRSK